MSRRSISLEPSVRDYALSGGRTTVDGWLEPGAIAATLVLADAQCELGAKGPAVEIGVHHGLYFILLALLSDGGLAIDVFEDQHLNTDYSGQGDRAMLESNLARFHPKPASIRIEQADSLETTADQLLEWLDGRAPRLFSIDGGHTPRHAENDIRLATSVCCEEAVIAVDDFENPSWLGVRTGIERFFHSGDTPWQPIALGDNKLFIAHESRADDYAQAIERAAETAGALGEHVSLLGHTARRIDFTSPHDIFCLGGHAPRLYSIGGAPTSKDAEDDIQLATTICGEDAVIVLDDFENPSRPGVREGAERFFHAGDTPWQPIATGKNKLYLAHESHAESYVQKVDYAVKSAGSRRKDVSLFGYSARQVAFTDPCDALGSQSYGVGGAWIRDLRVLDPSGRPVDLLRPGQTYRYAYKVDFEEQAKKVRFGMMIKLGTGFELAGQVSALPGQGLAKVDAGKTVSVEFDFEARLVPGTYFLNAGVLAAAGTEEVYLHRVIDGLTFEVVQEELSTVTGVADLSAHQGRRTATIRVEPLSAR